MCLMDYLFLNRKLFILVLELCWMECLRLDIVLCLCREGRLFSFYSNRPRPIIHPMSFWIACMVDSSPDRSLLEDWHGLLFLCLRIHLHYIFLRSRIWIGKRHNGLLQLVLISKLLISLLCFGLSSRNFGDKWI